MKILIIVDETPFYHPTFVNELIAELKKKNFQIYGARVTKIEAKNSLEKYLIAKFYRLYFSEIIKLLIKKSFFTILSLLFPRGLKNRFFSVKSVFRKNKISFINIEKNINQKKYFEKITNISPDLIVSSNSLFFNTEILRIPKYGCLNRHTSLLPSHGGLWPVLYSIAENDLKTGVSIHEMTSKIDTGKVYAQKEIDISKNKNMSSIYKVAFSLSTNLIIEAIDNLINDKVLNISRKQSYHSFPTKDDWLNFRRNGGRFI